MEGGAYLYILRCADGSYYVGTARMGLEQRVAEHNGGYYGGYTSTRRPVTLVYAEHFPMITDAIEAERQIKGWSRAKKEALIAGDWDRVSQLARRKGARSSKIPPVGGSSEG
jgi:putative endonuclease